MRRLITLNFLDAYVTGAYSLVVPLLLLERRIDLTTIGIIFSVLPLAYMLSRTLLASAADSIGFGKIFNVNALANLASVTLYAVSVTPVSYAFAKGTQGVKEASIWAVNRNAAYAITGREDPRKAAMVDFVRALALAAGTIVSGFLILFVGFQGIFFSLAVFSVLIFVPARMFKTETKQRLSTTGLLRRLDPRSVDHETWHTAMTICWYMIASSLVFSFILPIFLYSKGLGSWEIGMVLGIYNGVGGILLLFSVRRPPSVKITLLVQSILYLSAAVLVPVSESWPMIAMIIVMAFGEYTSFIVLETLISQSATGSENIATTIAFLFLPGTLAQIPALMFAGLLVEKIGYGAPFWIAGAFFVIYSLESWRIIRRSNCLPATPFSSAPSEL